MAKSNAIDLMRSSTDLQLVRIAAIRVEPLLSSYPFHQLAKRAQGGISLRTPADDGEINTSWEVTANSKYGHPGPLAFKIDKLIVDRRIDQVGKPLPELICLGSFRDICHNLEITVGSNVSKIKKAILQNVTAVITAKIQHRDRSGRERKIEIAGTRYSAIFTGETLPDGSKAEAVYIQLNGWYRDVLNSLRSRPLDFDYLRELPPAPQRLYEILSRQVYGALAGQRQRAKLIYSEYCMCAPQERYSDWEHVRKQMYKVHAPHLKYGYILKVDYQKTTDHQGNPDWEMLYTPGPKATAEYQVFTHRQIRQQSPALQGNIIDAKVQQPVQTTLELTDDDHPLLIELTRRGITDKKARELLAELSPGQEVMDQIEWTDAIIAKAPAGKFHNPPGLYVATIRDNVTPPATFLSSRKCRLQEEAQQAKNAELARHAQQELAYAEYQSQAIESYIRELPEREYHQMLLEARRQLKRSYSTMTETQLEELAANWVRADVKNSGGVRVLGFEKFCGSELVRGTA